MRVALWAGLLVVSPYVLYLLFHFIAPGLYSNERRHALRAVGGGYIMFLLTIYLNCPMKIEKYFNILFLTIKNNSGFRNPERQHRTVLSFCFIITVPCI